MKQAYHFESTHKQLYFQPFDATNLDFVNSGQVKPFIKVLLVPEGYRLTIDFAQFLTTRPTLFFVNANQTLEAKEATSQPATLLYYNRDFYCVQIHDAEVACDGILFNNILSIPMVGLTANELSQIAGLFDNIRQELAQQDTSSEEMIRIYLKQIIILATRIWKSNNLRQERQISAHTDQELFRDFGRLVEIHFREKHAVADYAELLHLAPKSLANKFNRLKLGNPNEVIKDRIILEAKRLLFYTDLTAKEIAYQLGYDDPAYFNRLFTQRSGLSPAVFRKGIQS